MAVSQGMNAIAFSEHGKIQGWVSKKLYCDEKGIKYMHAVEMYLTEHLEPKVRDNYHTVLIAKNLDGVHELNRLMELSSNKEHSYYTNRITFDEFLSLSDNIIAISACLASPLSKLPDNHPRYMELARRYDYLEVQPHICDDQREYNKRLLNLSIALGKPLIAGTDTHSSTPYKAECRKILMRYKDKTFGNEDDFDLTWKTYDELVEMFRLQGALPEEIYLQAIENTNVMADSVETFELDRSIKYPILYGSREEDSRRFDELIARKFKEKLESGVIPPDQEKLFRAAIKEEVRVFRKLQMDGFMLSMAELIGWCKEQGMAIGTARGSVGGSRVAYVVDIIDLNPETWNTVFSRFCNEDRKEIGDIDIDVVDTDRPAIFQHIIERFGKAHTARVGSFGTIVELGTIDAAGGALRKLWEIKHHPENFVDERKKANWSSYKFDEKNPWTLKKLDKIKKEFGSDQEAARAKYPELFYYYDGLFGTKVSQSVHPAGIVISPIDLDSEYGVFDKDGERCLTVDMEELHEVGAAKYDFLILKNVTIIRDTCRLIGVPYPKTHEIDWYDENVWDDMLRSPVGIFQMEGKFAFDCLRKFRPRCIEDMSLVTACIRPSGASYRDDLLSRKTHRNPSPIIDEILSDNNGYLVYQCDIIKFLQKVCGLSGSEADNIRRAIGRKDHERLSKAMPAILEGYCSKSDKTREEAEKEAKEFLQVIEDASSYMFGYNHSIAYCLLGYMCAYFRYYYPTEFITAFLNNAANEDDTANGTALARLYKIKITSPKFGISRSNYSCSVEDRTIAKGMASIKHMSGKAPEALYSLSKGKTYESFSDLLYDIRLNGCANSRELDILIHIDFFSMFGNQRELERILSIFEMFKDGSAKQISRSKVDGTLFEDIIKKYSIGKKKSGEDASNYTILDAMQIIRECEQKIKSLNIQDIGLIAKISYFSEAMGYNGYTTGRDEDRPKLFVRDIHPLNRKSDGKQFGYSISTQSIGSGVESKFTIFSVDYDEPIQKGDVILCLGWTKSRGYFSMTGYKKIYPGDEEDEA